MTRGVLGTLQGELGEAVADLELSTPMAQEHGEVLACALGHAYLCLAFVFSGRHAEAAAAGAVAAERLQAIDHFSGLVSLDIHMGYLHLLSGELDAAAQEALGEDCYAALFRDGAGRPLDLMVTLAVTDADELPATPGRQRPAGLLTGRERQIAALVGEGRSNRDIAQQLGISKRTVDAHLEHIFGKLGISSRVQLATGLSPTGPSPERPPPPPAPPGP